MKDGSGPVGDVEQWQVFRLNAKFNLPDLMVHEGDTTVITLPEKLKFNQTTEFDIKTGDGNVVAHAVIDGRAKTITLTYTDYTENHSDVSGSFFYVQMDRDKVDGKKRFLLRSMSAGIQFPEAIFILRGSANRKRAPLIKVAGSCLIYRMAITQRCGISFL